MEQKMLEWKKVFATKNKTKLKHRDDRKEVLKRTPWVEMFSYMVWNG